MDRRQFIKGSFFGAVGLAGGAAIWLNTGSNQDPLTISAVMAKLDDISPATLAHKGAWDCHQIFSHCAQSIEYSMTGYPEHKSELFKNTLGSVAFSAFATKGAMVHGLDEAIPGAPMIDAKQDSALALEHLKKSLLDFEQFDGTLQPHFAYGELTKAEYEAAHVMHIYNHWQEIVAA
mgnify:CR=1 FL=1